MWNHSLLMYTQIVSELELEEALHCSFLLVRRKFGMWLVDKERTTECSTRANSFWQSKDLVQIRGIIRMSASSLPQCPFPHESRQKYTWLGEIMEKEMATHSSVLAWRIPWTEKPGRLQSMESHRVGQDWSDLAAATGEIKSGSVLKTQPWKEKIYQWMLLLLLSRFSHVRLCATPWTAAHQAPPSMGFSRQEYWSGLPLPSPEYAI